MFLKSVYLSDEGVGQEVMGNGGSFRFQSVEYADD